MTKTRSAHGVPEIQSPLSLIYAVVRDHHPHLAFNSAISWMLNHGKTLMDISSRVRTWSPLLIPVVTCQCCAVSAFRWSKQVSRLLIYHRGLRHRCPVIERLEWWPLACINTQRDTSPNKKNMRVYIKYMPPLVLIGWTCSSRTLMKHLMLWVTKWWLMTEVN